MSSSWFGFGLWSFVVLLVIYLVLTLGIWIGLVALWKSHRGASWWLMVLGMVSNTLSPIFYAIGAWQVAVAFERHFGSMSASGGPSAASFPSSGGFGPSQTAGILMAVSVIAFFGGIIAFAVGFALHGFKASRGTERIRELEQLTEAMSEELGRVRQG